MQNKKKTKICSVCHIEKEATNEYFSINGSYLNVKCKECSKEYSRLHHLANKEKINQRQASLKAKAIDNLTDYYIKIKIKADTKGLSHNELPQELVDLKRKQLILYRNVKNQKRNSSTDNNCNNS